MNGESSSVCVCGPAVTARQLPRFFPDVEAWIVYVHQGPRLRSPSVVCVVNVALTPNSPTPVRFVQRRHSRIMRHACCVCAAIRTCIGQGYISRLERWAKCRHQSTHNLSKMLLSTGSLISALACASSAYAVAASGTAWGFATGSFRWSQSTWMAPAHRCTRF